ncbi:dehydrogenase [Vibrio panuliri]|uniref:Dehydrogenase n=1 Tax=Vibrio panuliri TaxID=1381081 RepID=A0A1Q9H9Y4_9VIBR|nr:iron-containing alcohol dehydrogenase [Vibrio panuliri]OLQ85858.1 dehydrogenase [Vibrio panuliri]
MLHQCLVRLKQPFIKAVPVPEPKAIIGWGKISEIANVCRELGVTKPLIVTDTNIVQIGLLDRLLNPLHQSNIQPCIFKDVEPDPGFSTVRRGVALYKQHARDSVIALGGGSVIDCAKAIAACIKTNKDIAKLPGLLTVRRRLMPVIAIPTTAGTGSEGTVAAVLSDTEKRKKRVITDPFMVPKIALVDAQLMVGLPTNMTAETGIDALTHAIESYLSFYSTSYTRKLSLDSIERIFSNLELAANKGTDQVAREQMAIASYQAGLAFTRTYVGYVHAIAHQLGATYHVPHGRANAIVLTHVLKFYRDNQCPRLTKLAHDLSYQNSDQLIKRIDTLLKALSVPLNLPMLKADDINELAKSSIKEAFGEYPVPVEMSVSQCEAILRKLLVSEYH